MITGFIVLNLDPPPSSSSTRLATIVHIRGYPLASTRNIVPVVEDFVAPDREHAGPGSKEDADL